MREQSIAGLLPQKEACEGGYCVTCSFGCHAMDHVKLYPQTTEHAQ